MRGLLSALGRAVHPMTLHTGTAWRIPYIDSSGAAAEQALGASGTTFTGTPGFVGSGSSGQYTQGSFGRDSERTKTTAWNRNVGTTSLGNGYLSNTGSTSDITWDLYHAGRTWKVRVLALQDLDAGIITNSIDAVSQGTMDYYGASTYNTMKEHTGLALSAGLHAYKQATPTKNASSSGYREYLHSWCWVSTGA